MTKGKVKSQVIHRLTEVISAVQDGAGCGDIVEARLCFGRSSSAVKMREAGMKLCQKCWGNCELCENAMWGNGNMVRGCLKGKSVGKRCRLFKEGNNDNNFKKDGEAK